MLGVDDLFDGSDNDRLSLDVCITSKKRWTNGYSRVQNIYWLFKRLYDLDEGLSVTNHESKLVWLIQNVGAYKLICHLSLRDFM